MVFIRHPDQMGGTWWPTDGPTHPVVYCLDCGHPNVLLGKTSIDQTRIDKFGRVEPDFVCTECRWTRPIQLRGWKWRPEPRD